MPRWEYLFVEVIVEKGVDRVYSINGQTLDDWQHGPLVHEYINAKGEQGWELVAAPYTVRSNVHTDGRLIFKRPGS